MNHKFLDRNQDVSLQISTFFCKHKLATIYIQFEYVILQERGIQYLYFAFQILLSLDLELCQA